MEIHLLINNVNKDLFSIIVLNVNNIHRIIAKFTRSRVYRMSFKELNTMFTTMNMKDKQYLIDTGSRFRI